MNDQGMQKVSLAFAAGKLRPGELRLLGVRGREQISRLFAFDLLLSRDAGPLSEDEIDRLFSVPCAIAMGEGPGDVVRGVLESVRRLPASRSDTAHYLARMVPTAALLGLSRTNRVFQNLTVPEIVASVLAHYRLDPERDYRINVRGKSPKREHVVQYEESDWDFVSRWLEHEGLYYWFEHGGERELLVISDSRDGAPPIADPSALRYRSANTLDVGEEASVWDWEMTQQRVPARVVLFDYNYRTPHVRLVARAPADDKTGFGTVMRYGDHFKTVDEGAALAKLRAERLASGRRVYGGTTDCARFRVGHWFSLTDHDEPDQDRKYLITEIEHEVGEMPGEDPRRYAARFRAIPLDVQFRPEQRTPWPSIHGLMHGHVAGDGPGTYAEIDDLGRYKVSLPFDSGNARGAAVSRWIRMAQPSSGSGYGSHHPLHKGVEVLIAFIDGDPDRPIIVGSVPNTHTVSPSTKQNATQSVIRTASGIHLEMEDLANAGTTAHRRKR
jgi:type VI secretion system secreted protein VgrG